jgi:aspartate racemase
MGDIMKKVIGIIGGMSPESTVEYYRHIVHTYKEKYGDHSFPEIVVYSVSFQPYIEWTWSEQWSEIASGLSSSAQNLEAAGADFLVIATNTMHIVIEDIRKSVQIPILSLLDVVGNAITEKGLKTVGLLGTKFTMEKTFYPEAMALKGVKVITPDPEDQELINTIIYEELVAGKILNQSRIEFVNIINKLIANGAEGIILGCTEIPLLIHASDVDITLFDTTCLHAEAALSFALDE